MLKQTTLVLTCLSWTGLGAYNRLENIKHITKLHCLHILTERIPIYNHAGVGPKTFVARL